MKPKQHAKTWKPFYFSSKKAACLIGDRNAWREILRIHKDDADYLKTARKAPASGAKIPIFGLFPEHCCEPRLGEWAARHGMNLDT